MRPEIQQQSLINIILAGLAGSVKPGHPASSNKLQQNGVDDKKQDQADSDDKNEAIEDEHEDTGDVY